MPANRNNNISNPNSFFSSIIPTSSPNQRIPLGTARSTTTGASGSWIVTELQQAQRQIQRTLQSVTTANNHTINATETNALDPAAAPFYLHPRQSSHAEFLEARQQQQQQIQRPSILSPQTIQAARAASTADELIESYLEAAMADNNEGGSEMETETEMETEIDAFIQTSSSTSTFDNNSLPIQLQQVIRNASALQNSSIRATPRVNNNTNSALRNKIVYRLQCLYCTTPVCERAMRAILLADTKIELYSTDIPPQALKTMDEDRLTQGCNCRIRDTVCTGW
jgi:hypothetical protein